MTMKPVFDRWYADTLRKKLSRPYVHVLFGARQTGKSTLLRTLLPAPSLVFDCSDPRERTRLLASAGEFADACLALPRRRTPHVVLVDEAQAVPAVFDAVQYLYDRDRSRWRFVLCGSSARKLRATGANLLPGRSFLHRLYPLTLAEQPAPSIGAEGNRVPPSFAWSTPAVERTVFPAWDIEERLAFGALPGIVAAPKRDRADALRGYAEVHLEEEIRRESMVRDWGAFVRFLRFAARESGNILNFAAIAQETGISQPTIKSYYQLLEDMFVGFRVPGYSGSARKNLLSTPRFLFFDLGVRHAAADLRPSLDTVRADPGPLFEQWVGIELWKRLQYLGQGELQYLRTRDGAEVDYIVRFRETLVPIEVKWTDRPSLSDARHVLAFLADLPKRARRGYVVCRCPRPVQLHEQVLAIPWQML
jgi:predicted AAA+ superfamily ATPase